MNKFSPKNKYWQNLNLAIGNCAYKFLLRHRAFVRKSARGLTEVSRNHGRVSTRGHHIYKSTSTPLLGEVLECKIESGNLQDRYAVAVHSQENGCWKNIGSLPVVSPKSRKNSLYGYWSSVSKQKIKFYNTKKIELPA